MRRIERINRNSYCDSYEPKDNRCYAAFEYQKCRQEYAGNGNDRPRHLFNEGAAVFNPSSLSQRENHCTSGEIHESKVEGRKQDQLTKASE